MVMNLKFIKRGVKEIFNLKPWEEMTVDEKVDTFFLLFPVIVFIVFITVFYTFWLDVWESILDGIGK